MTAPTRHTTKTCRPCRNSYANTSRYGDPLGRTPPGNPRLPWNPIQTELDRITGGHCGSSQASQILGYHHTEIGRWRTVGVHIHTADRIATRLGYHPALLWPNWWDIPFIECPCLGIPEPEEVAA